MKINVAVLCSMLLAPYIKSFKKPSIMFDAFTGLQCAGIIGTNLAIFYISHIQTLTLQI